MAPLVLTHARMDLEGATERRKAGNAGVLLSGMLAALEVEDGQDMFGFSRDLVVGNELNWGPNPGYLPHSFQGSFFPGKPLKTQRKQPVFEKNDG